MALHCMMFACPHSLELELSGELVLRLLQLLPAPHVLIVHVLDLRFDALELGVQLDEKRRAERVRRGSKFPLKNWFPDQLPIATALEALVSEEPASQWEPTNLAPSSVLLLFHSVNFTQGFNNVDFSPHDTAAHQISTYSLNSAEAELKRHQTSKCLFPQSSVGESVWIVASVGCCS